jgi:exodeoxyribonuclease VIII|tara:strand:- start:566 stop:1387 length:822 start_codon:yes stop_codon:yes gene_type:complete
MHTNWLPIDMTHDQYHDLSAIGRSALLTFAQSPAHFWHAFLNPKAKTKAPTPAMLFGAAFHAYVLEPLEYKLKYIEAPTASKVSKAYRQAEADAHTNQQTILPKGTNAHCHQLSLALQDHPMAHQILSANGFKEATFLAKCPKTDLEVKCRADCITNSGWVVDLKTTQNASPDAFTKTIANFQYHVQAGFYLDVIEWASGIRPKGFLFICIEKEAPFAVSVIRASNSMIQAGSRRARSLLDRMAECFKHLELTQPWPAYSPDIIEVNLPAWAS